jgi:arylformamidase
VGRLIDLTVGVRPGMVVYPGDPEVRMELAQSLAGGDDADVTRIDMGAHTGTHVDAPRHFLAGAAGVDALPLDAMLGDAWVLDARSEPGEVGPDALAALPEGVRRVLVRTRNAAMWGRGEFPDDPALLSAAGAEALVARGVVLVGWDGLSVGGHDAHRVLLRAGVVILEGLDLRQAPIGACRLICLPVKLVGADGAPARVVIEVDGA